MHFKPFQLQDYARLALTDGAILGHDTGLGKTWAGYTYPLLKCGFTEDSGRITPNAPVLIVAPGDLHDQWIREGAEHFRTTVTRLDSQATFLSLSRISPLGVRTLPPGFYITSYTALGHNGIRLLPKPDKLKTEADAQTALAFLGTTWQAAVNWHDTSHRSHQSHQSHPLHPTDQSDTGTCGSHSDQLSTVRKFITARLEEVTANVGWWNTEQSKVENPKSKIKCVWDPTLADLIMASGAATFACVVVDEGTKIKGGFDTQIGSGVLQLEPAYRLVLTATPIKNRLPNLFALAWWACGGKLDAHSRWPYSLDDAGDFARTFCVSERNLTREAKAVETTGRRTRSRLVKLTPQVCNVHKVWKLLAPIILRRRKKDIGEDIVPKFRQVYRVPMGTLQAQVYKSHLDWNPVDVNGKPAIGPKIQALRMAAAAPHSALLRLGRAPAYCPKMAATLTLVEQILRRGKQVIIFSPFHDPLDEISRRLRHAGVPHEVLDGRTSPNKRGEIASCFKLGPPSLTRQESKTEKAGGAATPVLLAGSESMAEGHSFPRCSYVIQYSYPWALDKVLQSEDRAHRLNSVEPLQVYRLITEGSVDRKMESQIDEKSDAAELVLDGHLIGQQTQEVNLAELLDIATKEFDETSQTIDEKTLEAEWDGAAGTRGLRARLREAAQEWALGPALPAEPSILSVPISPPAPVPAPAPGKPNWRAHWQLRQPRTVAAPRPAALPRPVALPLAS